MTGRSSLWPRAEHSRRNCRYNNPKVRTRLVYEGTEKSVMLEHGAWGGVGGVIRDGVGKMSGG